MIVREKELYHFGVKGMKWGVRKAQKQKYGLSKREVKKKIKQAKRDYRENDNPNHTYNGITGKNWKRVLDDETKAVTTDSKYKKLISNRDKAYDQANKWGAFGPNRQSERWQNKGDDYDMEAIIRKKEIGKKFASRYDEALLKDIGYENIQKGRKMLKEYRIKNSWGKYTG